MNSQTRLTGSALIMVSAPLIAATNTGQDATQPLTRFDIRYQHNTLPYDAYYNSYNKTDSDTIVLRADAPISLDKKGVLYVRMDVPLISRSSSTPGGDGSLDLGSIYGQAIYISPKELMIAGKFAWGAGIAAQLGTATNGRQETTWAPTFGMSVPIHPFGKKHGGSAFIPLVKYFFGPEESLRQDTLQFEEISEISFLPTINFTLPWGIKTQRRIDKYRICFFIYVLLHLLHFLVL